jgi:hypothetical protein
MEEIQVDVKKVNVILDKWENRTGPGGLQYRDFVRQTLFALGSSPDQLAKLGDSLERKQGELRGQVGLMSGFGVGTVLAQANPPHVQVPVQHPEIVSILFVDSINESESPYRALWKTC